MQTTGTMSFNINYTQPIPFIRLAEIYLNYSEAKLALGDEATCRTYINKVRARTGVNLPPVTETGAALRTRLINERRIELAFEGHRFFDVRRWKIADQIDAFMKKYNGFISKEDLENYEPEFEGYQL
jgi:hypothetical protein